MGNVTGNAFDPAGNLLSITDPNGHVTRYTYDALNRKLTETYPDAAPNTVAFSYDAIGNLLTKTDQKGQVTTHTYNDLYQMLSRGVTGCPADTFTYDVGGRMLSATRGTWTVTFQYDAANRVTQTIQGGHAVNYAYNTANRTRIITYPGGRVLTEAKDLRDRLESVSDTAGVIAGYTYDNANRVQARAYANGVTATYAHDALNRITSLDHVRNGARIAGFTHSYDNEGNKKYEEKLHQPANSEAYGYDNLYRLTDFKVGVLTVETIPTPTNHSTWALDPVGNWNNRVTDGTTETRSHGAANEIESLTSSGATNAITHDANGNLTSVAFAVPADGRSFEYDEFNRLIRVSILNPPSTILAEYAYDALGRRIMKHTWPAGQINETCFAYDGARIIEEQACSAGTPATYTYGNYIDEVLTRDTATQRLYYHQNALFSVVALTDPAANVVERYSYDAYGKPSFYDAAGLQQPASSIQNRLLFTGREWDAESALYHYRARPYNPTLGRFLSRDPLGYVDGMNVYEYVSGNPVGWLDSLGLVKCCFNGQEIDIDCAQVRYIKDKLTQTIRNTFSDFAAAESILEQASLMNNIKMASEGAQAVIAGVGAGVKMVQSAGKLVPQAVTTGKNFLPVGVFDKSGKVMLVGDTGFRTAFDAAQASRNSGAALIGVQEIGSNVAQWGGQQVLEQAGNAVGWGLDPAGSAVREELKLGESLSSNTANAIRTLQDFLRSTVAKIAQCCQ